MVCVRALCVGRYCWRINELCIKLVIWKSLNKDTLNLPLISYLRHCGHVKTQYSIVHRVRFCSFNGRWFADLIPRNSHWRPPLWTHFRLWMHVVVPLKFLKSIFSQRYKEERTGSWQHCWTQMESGRHGSWMVERILLSSL